MNERWNRPAVRIIVGTFWKKLCISRLKVNSRTNLKEVFVI